jgi:HNH endonuclease
MHRIALVWNDYGIDGYADLFAPNAFEREGNETRQLHQVRSPRGGLSIARFDLAVAGRHATLDYTPYEAENEAAGMLIGRMRLGFADSARTKVTSVAWADSTDGRFERVKVKPALEPWDPGAYQPRREAGSRRIREEKERPGQQAFKAELLLAYQGSCCISGCSVVEALDAAHIDQFVNVSHDHLANGLLLRRDLHRLFDEHLISVHPETREVDVHQSARIYEPYASLVGTRIAEPRSGPVPDTAALRRHFKQFQRKAK